MTQHLQGDTKGHGSPIDRQMPLTPDCPAKRLAADLERRQVVRQRSVPKWLAKRQCGGAPQWGLTGHFKLVLCPPNVQPARSRPISAINR
jgi:hypothetical protein